VVAGKAYIGGGAAGVLCVDADRATLDGKALDLPALRKVMAAGWKQLQAKYEAERKTDEFAVPPNENQLPDAAPARLWQAGAEKWHVDAPVAVAGDRVLAGSAFLDKERVGDRALLALDARTGKVAWRAPLKLNPWGGPAVQGDTVVITGSTIGYYPTLLKGARGLIAAYNLADGKPRWAKEVPGGVVGCAALAGGSAITTATDGKVRAFDLATGERRWIYDARAALFAPPAVAGDLVYAGDLRGAVHAIDLKTGRAKWQPLDLGKHPDVRAPGMIYAGPVVHAGRLYIATCNLEGPYAGQPTALVCVGEK
jgi:outer membrane protein assembly factor BamB